MEARRKAAKKQLLASGKPSRPVDVVDQGSIVRALGDHVNTRMKNIEFDDDLDAELFDDRAKTLREEAAIASGSVRRATSKLVRSDIFAHPKPAFIGHNRNTITCCCMLDTTVFYGDKSGGLYYYDIREKVATAITPQPTEGVLSVAVADPREATNARAVLLERSTVENSTVPHLAVGLENGTIHVWLVQYIRGRVQLTHRGLLKLHRTGVTGLAFRTATTTLYSCSKDSTVRVWAVAEMAPIDRFFGHTGKVLQISSLRRERAATVGEDRTVRYWKMDTATQVEFAMQESVVESVAMLTDETMIAGTADGKLLAFDAAKKNPIASVALPHGFGEVGDGTGLEQESLSSTANRIQNGNAISAVAVTPYGDLVATGSMDNRVLLWRFTDGKLQDSSVLAAAAAKSAPVAVGFHLLGELPTVGIVNALTFSADGTQLVIVTAKEQRFGRWITKRDAMNGIVVVPLTTQSIAALASMPSAAAPTSTTRAAAPKQQQQQHAVANTASKSPLLTSSSSAARAEAEEDDEFNEEDEMESGDQSAESDLDDAEGDEGTSLEQTMFEVGENGQLIFKGTKERATTSSSAPKGNKKIARAPLQGNKNKKALLGKGAKQQSAKKSVVNDEVGVKKTKKIPKMMKAVKAGKSPLRKQR